VANQVLWRGGEAIALRPKVFALLRCLAERSGQLVSKAALCRAVWPDVVVGDGGLMVCIRELRRELGDSPRAPRYIETRPRRGYRFIADIRVVPGRSASRGAEAPAPTSAVRAFGRGPELACLHAWLDQARGARRQVAFLTGEAGVGKTTLVEAFIEELRARGDLMIARGQCVEHYGPGEAYLPFLEALGGLCRGPRGRDVVALLTHAAPTWLVQMPWFLSPSELDALQRRVASATRERMLRELAEALEALTAVEPLLLVLEDLHWSDPSTRTLIAWLARRREPARLVVLGTYRPSESGPEAAMHALEQELQIRGQCEELPLKLLSEAAVAEYLAARLPGAPISPELPRLLHHRTDGNPLFMINMLEFWRANSWLEQIDGEWSLGVADRQLSAGVPDNLRQMVERWLDRLDLEEQRLLEIASVAGVEFSAASVAAGLNGEVERIEDRCRAAARRGQFIRAAGEECWPDGTAAGRYAFVHALYCDVLYSRVSPSARGAIHRRIAARQEAAYGARAGEIASPLATHFERGLDSEKAVAYLRLAAQAAVRRYATLEAIDLLSKALSLLEGFAEGPARSHLELGVLTALGPALTTVKGYGAPEVELIYARARALCERLGDTPDFFPVLRGLVTLQQHRGHLETARQLARELRRLSERSQDPELLLQARQACGTTSFYLGDHVGACRDLRWCIAHHDLAEHRSRAGRSGMCTTVVCQGHLAWALYHLGYLERALATSRAALGLSRELEHPQDLALALYSAASLYQSMEDVAAARDHAESLVALAAEHGFAFWSTYGAALQGWAIALHGDGELGKSFIRGSLSRLAAEGAEMPRTYFLGLLADACARSARVEEGLDAVDEALAAVEARGERFWEPELHRLRGELSLGAGRRQGLERRERAVEEAEKSFVRALDVARRLRARSFELRAATSLGGLWRRTGRERAARRLLAPIYRRFTEGFNTPPLEAARALLLKLRN